MPTFDMNNTINVARKIDKYVIYLRRSRADIEAEKLGEGETLARHKKILLELAARKQIYVDKIYEEIVSGDTIAARPEIQKMINECYEGKYRGILIVDISRLSRGNQGDAQVIMDCVRYSNMNKGLLVVTPTKTYDVANSPEDEEYMEFELFMSRRELKMINKRMLRGRTQAVVEGNYMSGPRPYGYNIVRTKTSRTLIPNELEAPVVKKIFEWAVKHNLSNLEIARRLTAMGVPTYRGDKEWHKDSIKAYLMNPVYIGKVRWNNRMRIKTMVNGELKVISPRIQTDKYMLYDGKHKKYALVDEETFEAAQKRFYTDRTKSGLKLVNPIAGLLYCKNCGKSMKYQQYKNRQPRYVHKTAYDCKVKSAYVDDVIAAVIHGLKMYMGDYELKIDNSPDIDENSVEIKIKELENEVRKIKKKKANLFDLMEDEKITSNEFVERKAIHDERLEALEQQIDEFRYAIPEKEEYQETLLMLSDAFIAMTDEELDAASKNKFLKKIIKRIDFSRENDAEFILDIDLH